MRTAPFSISSAVSSKGGAGARAPPCCAFRLRAAGTFLDRVGGIVEGRPRPPGQHGVRFVQLRSWLESEGAIAEAFTVAPIDPGREASGCLPVLLSGLVRPLLDRLLPAHPHPARPGPRDDRPP